MSVFDDRGNIRPGRAWLYGLTAALTLFVILPISVWAFGVFTSGTRGAGNEEKQKNSVTNRVYWQNEFNGLAENIATFQAQIATAHAAEVAHPNDTFYEQNLAGLVQECDIAVGQYNADTAKPIASPWLPAGLPTSYDRTTTCGG